jgi:hypothetical protein
MDTYAYQQEGISWMLDRERCKTCRGGFLCHEMGLGKTFMTSTLIKTHLEPRTLILAPKSTLMNWTHTLRTVGNFAFNVYDFRKDLVLPESRPAVVVASHQSVLRQSGWIVAAGFQRIIVDEAHILRNTGGKVSAGILRLARDIPIRWGITATPFNNKDSDINAYITFLFPRHAPDARPPSTIFKHIMTRKLRKDVFPHGPKLIIRKHVYEFEYPEEQDMYNFVAQRIDQQAQWLAANRGHLPHHVIGAMIILQMLRERQATIHPQIVLNAERTWRAAFGQGHDVPEWDKTRVTKVNHVLRLVGEDQENRKSTLIITHFKDEIGLIVERLEAARVPYRVLNGKTGKIERRRIELHGTPAMSEAYTGKFVDKWTQQKVGAVLPTDVMERLLTFTHKPTVVVMQIQAGGVGISLPWIHHVINLSPDWNPFLERQAIYRAYRLTTPHNVHVTQLFLQDTIDRTIHTKQMHKLLRSLAWTGDSEDTLADFAEPTMLDNEEEDEA